MVDPPPGCPPISAARPEIPLEERDESGGTPLSRPLCPTWRTSAAVAHGVSDRATASETLHRLKQSGPNSPTPISPAPYIFVERIWHCLAAGASSQSHPNRGAVLPEDIPQDEVDGETDESCREQLSRLRDGCVLMARENLLDPNFMTAVVIICIYNTDGAYGLVMNRLSHMPLSEIFDAELPDRSQRRKIYMGGPVRQDTLQLLQRTRSPVNNAYKVAEDVFLGGEWNALDQVLQADEETTRLFLGYSGWSPGQLETEISQGAWEVFAPNLASLLAGPEEPLQGSVSTIRDYLKSLEQLVV